MRLVFGQDEAVAQWVVDRIPYVSRGFGENKAIGVVDPTGRPVAGVVFHDYQPDHGTVQVSMAADTPRWAQRGIIRGILDVPFFQYRCNKVWSAIAHTNKRAIKFNRGIGFVQEGVLRHQFGKGSHAVITGLLKHEYLAHFAKEREHGQGCRLPAAAA